MLKRLDSEYGVGRRKGGWWKWKVQPYTVDAVMIYAQAGHGRRASLHTDYTFAVWDGGALVPFAKAYSGLTDARDPRARRVDRANTVEKFGPVRHVKPVQVFELGFEGIQRVAAAQVGGRGAISADPAVAHGQASGGRGQLATLRALR